MYDHITASVLVYLVYQVQVILLTYLACLRVVPLVLQILYLQNNITALNATINGNETVTLNDICFQPLAPDNTNCTINSVVQYFQVTHY